MKHFLKIFISLAVVTLGFLIFSEDSFVDSDYTLWYDNASDFYKDRFLAKFVGLIQYLLVFSWLTMFSFLYWYLDRPLDIRENLKKFNPEFYEEITDIFKISFNDRLHELYQDTLQSFLREPLAHENVVINTLYKLRWTLIMSYKYANVRITIFIPQEIEGETKLKLEYWANSDRRTPRTRKDNITFGRNEGFAGYAWDSGRPQSGGKKKYLFLPEVRYRKTSVDQDRVHSFCAIPIFDEGPVPGQHGLIAVICIDADRRMYFPYRKQRFEEFVDTIRPFLILINFHLTYREKLVNDTDMASGSGA